MPARKKARAAVSITKPVYRKLAFCVIPCFEEFHMQIVF
jgi:hypothetical protein